MKKLNNKRRSIAFVSVKDNQQKRVSSNDELRFARWLDRCPDVVRYETQVPIDSVAANIPVHGIRKDYRSTSWETDFVVEYSDGHKEVFEISSCDQIERDAGIEQLEISRRYWTSLDIARWRIVLKEDIKSGTSV